MIPWVSTSLACEERLQKAKKLSFIRIALAFVIPFLAFFIQVAIWPHVQPFFWFLFYLAVFLSASIGGLVGGLISTFLSTLLCWYYFIPPERTLAKPEPKYLLTTVAFLLMGILVSVLNGRLRKTIQNQKRFQEKAKLSEARMKEAQRIGRFGSWTWDVPRNKVERSEETLRIFGLEPSLLDVTADSFFERIHPEDRALVKSSLNDAIRNAKPYSIEYRILLPSGEERVVHSKVDVYLDKSGRPLEVIGTVYDITEREKIEEAYRESERKFRGLLETACDPIVIVDAHGKIEFVNQQTKKTLGYEREDLLGKSIEVLIPERFRSTHLNQRNQYMESPSPRPMGRNLQLSARKKDGSDLPVDISLSPFKTNRGTIVTAFMRDVSEVKRHEAQQRFLFDTIRVLSETMDYQERIQRIADLVVPPLADCCVIHILEEEKLVQKALGHHNGFDKKALWEAFEKCNFNEPQFIEEIDDQILKQMTSGNEDLFLQMKSFGVHSWISVPMVARGRTIGVISLMRCRPLKYTAEDLNLAHLVADRAAVAVDNARLYLNAQKAIGLREDVLAIVSHDLKNPLGVIRGYNEIVADHFGGDSNDMQVKASQAIARSVRQMERLIGDLLDFAKIESGTLSIENRYSHASQLVNEGIESVQHHLDKNGIHVGVEIQSGLPGLFCDTDRIRQVFSNILGNAVKFSPQKSQIQVRAHLKGDEIVFSVSDQGPGIAQDSLRHLFDRYWQAKETAKQGAGLGLSIAKGIVDAHRGKIWVESVLGKGTTFYFSLPLGQSAKSANTNSDSNSNKKIFDKEDEMRRSLS